MAASLLPDSTLCIFPSPLPFIFSSVPFLLTYLSCSPSQVMMIERMMRRNMTLLMMMIMSYDDNNHDEDGL